MGRFDEALAEGRAAIDLDPASVAIRRSLGWLQYYARQYEAALDNLRRALAMDPTAEETHRLLGLVYMEQELHDEAAASFKESIALSQNQALAIAGLGQVAARRGRQDEARAILQAVHDRARSRYVSPVALTKLYTAIGDANSAFEWLEQAHRERRGWLAYLKVEPALDPLRGDPRFRSFVERMRLV
jgi:tetratricopeptide (TPR) repeat protein